jgi:glutaminase
LNATGVAQHHRLQELVEELHRKHAPSAEGTVATYIPELSKADPDRFGVCVVTAEGDVLSAGDCDQPFTIQSISKPSGDAFNSIWLHGGTNRPFNPMVNTGAIAVTALLHRRYGDRALDRILDRFSAMAGRRLSVDECVYESERRTGHRNRAIAHLLLNFDLVHDEAEAALDVYFKQCSILVTCRDLATMAATLANMGRNPITGEHVFVEMGCIKDVLSVMFTCGMYDYSGQWAYRVGVPAKSGVSGGVMAVVNRQLGIASYSPRLDAQGHSCRGIEVCVDLASRLGLHVFDCLNVGSSFLSAT